MTIAGVAACLLPVRYSGGTSTLLPQYSQRTETASGTGNAAPQVGQWKSCGSDWLFFSIMSIFLLPVKPIKDTHDL
jgi:hypothetical protein